MDLDCQDYQAIKAKEGLQVLVEIQVYQVTRGCKGMMGHQVYQAYPVKWVPEDS